MYVVAKVRLGCNNLKRFVAHVLWMGCGETHSHLRNFLSYKAQELRESRSFAQVGVHILPQQGDFFVASISQVATFAQDAFHIPAAFTTSSIGHDAIVAEVVAASHNADETADVWSADSLRHDVAISLCG